MPSTLPITAPRLPAAPPTGRGGGRVTLRGLVVRPPEPRPATRARRSAKRVVAWAAVGFAAAHFGLAALAEANPRVRDPMYGDKFVKLRRRVAADPGAYTAVMLGSSRAGMAFHGLRAEAVLRAGRRPAVVFNLGVPATGPVTHRVYLDRMLAAGVTPDLLLVEVLPPMIGGGPDAPRERHWVHGDRLTAGEVDVVARFGFDEPATRGEWRRTVLAPLSALRLTLVGRAAPGWLPDRTRGPYEWGRGSDECGWNAMAKASVTPDERAYFTDKTRQEYAAVAAALDPGGPAVAALREVLAVCRARGIAARLVLLPEGSAFRALYPPAARARTVDLLTALAAEYAAPLVDATEWMPDDALPDGHHMFAADAAAFTERLARDVILPAAGPPPAGEAP